MIGRLALLVLLLTAIDSRSMVHAAQSCTVSTSGVAFGTYDPTSSAAVTAIGSVSFTCTYTGTGFDADLTLATGNSGSYTARSLKDGTNVLSYNLYVDTGHTEIYGNGTGGTYYYVGCYAGGTFTCPGGGAGSGTTYTGSVYGLVPASQDVSAGAYTDTMVLTVTY